MKNLLITTILILSSVNLFAQGSVHSKVFANFNYDLDADPEYAYKNLR